MYLKTKVGRSYVKCTYYRLKKIEKEAGTSLVVQWLSICLSVQGAQALSLVWKDPTCGETEPVHHKLTDCGPRPPAP